MNKLNKYENIDLKVNSYEQDSPLSKKKDKIKFFSNDRKIPLYGYKFQFVGRFTRKQKSANLWFIKGYLETSSFDSNVDYSQTSVILRFSVCSVKVWLYKSLYASLYAHKIYE